MEEAPLPRERASDGFDARPTRGGRRPVRRSKAAGGRRYSPAPMFSKVLVANRGEIAVRVIRALKEMGIASVAVYSEVDREAPHVRDGGRGLPARPRARRTESYLKVEKLLEVAKQSGAEAIHPGYGFLAENARLRPCLQEGQGRVHRPAGRGDRGDGLEDQGARADAGRRRADRAGHDRAGRDARGRARRSPRRSAIRSRSRRPAAAAARASASRCPRTSWRRRSRAPPARARSSSPTRPSTWSATSRTRATSRCRCSADAKGTVVHLGERDCSVQRRHQKLVEETPAPGIDEEFRERIGKIATDAARGDRVPLGRHDRGPAGAGRRRRARILLPRDEHPRPGRAHGHRDGDRHRHRAGADPDRGRRAAVVLPGGRASCAAGRSSAASTPRPRTRSSRPRPGGSPHIGSPPGPACASTRA